MTTTIKTRGPLTVTNVLHNTDGDRRSIAQDGSKFEKTTEGSCVIHNTLSVEIEGEGRIEVKSSSFATEIVSGGTVVAVVDAGETGAMPVSGTVTVRQAEPAGIQEEGA